MPTPPKRKPDSARRANRIIQQRTLLLLALLGIGTFLLLFAQLYKGIAVAVPCGNLLYF